MFDKIPLLMFQWKIPRTPKNKKLFSDFSFSFPKDAMSATDASFSDFALDGTQHFIHLRPISDYTREHFLYLQSFVYLESKSAYFTRRQNYSSFLIQYTYEGSGILEYENKTYLLTPGTGFLIDCRKPHYYHTESTNWTHSDIHFNGISADYFCQLWEKNGDISFSIPKAEFQNALENILYHYTNFSIERDFLVSNRLESLLLLLFHKRNESTMSSDKVIPENIRYLIKYMESNYAKPLTLDFLSAFAGISKFHLSREFKKYTGQSPNEFLIDLRLANAKFLLSDTNLPCYKIGELSGISDFNNFVRLFKKDTNMTPTQYRKQNALQ